MEIYRKELQKYAFVKFDELESEDNEEDIDISDSNEVENITESLGSIIDFIDDNDEISFYSDDDDYSESTSLQSESTLIRMMLCNKIDSDINSIINKSFKDMNIISANDMKYYFSHLNTTNLSILLHVIRISVQTNWDCVYEENFDKLYNNMLENIIFTDISTKHPIIVNKFLKGVVNDLENFICKEYPSL